MQKRSGYTISKWLAVIVLLMASTSLRSAAAEDWPLHDALARDWVDLGHFEWPQPDGTTTAGEVYYSPASITTEYDMRDVFTKILWAYHPGESEDYYTQHWGWQYFQYGIRCNANLYSRTEWLYDYNRGKLTRGESQGPVPIRDGSEAAVMRGIVCR